MSAFYRGTALICSFSISAEADPTVCSRILDLVGVRGAVPESFSARKNSGETLEIAVEMADLSVDQARLLASRFLKLPPAIEVAVDWLFP